MRHVRDIFRQTGVRLALVVLGSSAALTATFVALAVPVGVLADAGSGDPAEIELGALDRRSYVYSADGSELAGLHGEVNRELVTLDDVPPHLIDAILAVEDSGFWVHDGVDARGILRALKVNVDAGGVAQGGSTLTQQVVKLSLLSSEQSLERKVQELVLAHRLEEELTKEEILTRYVNLAYFGNGAYGVQVAAETYFGVSVGDLDIGQSALLAGMIRNPRYNDPVTYPENAEDRRRVALSLMESEGYISGEERALFEDAPLPTEVQRVVPSPDDYFVEEVKQRLLHDERFAMLGETGEEREQAVFRGGLRVHTTFDPQAQAAAESARDQVLPGDSGVFPASTDPASDYQGSAALVSVEPGTGAIRTMVGGPGFERDVDEATGLQYNLATDNQRQIGSTHKVFVLTSLMRQGHSPQDLVDGTGPCFFNNPDGEPDPYEVTNFDDDPGSIDTITNHTAASVNCAYVRLASIAGYPQVEQTAHDLGVTSDIVDELSSALGASEVTPIEMASAYATLANGGVRHEPYYIDRIETPDGRVIYEHEPTPERVLPAETARLVTSVLEQNVIRGTGTRAAVPGHQVAGKTGTTTANADVWFVGYARQLATAVWIGGLGSNESITIDGASPSSSRHAGRMFGIFMGAYLGGREPAAFDAPPSRPGGEFLAPDPSFDLSGRRARPEEGEDGRPPGEQPDDDGDGDGGDGDEGGDGPGGGGGGDGGGPSDEPAEPTTTSPPTTTTTTQAPPPPPPTEPPPTTTSTTDPDPGPGPGPGNGGGGGGQGP